MELELRRANAGRCPFCNELNTIYGEIDTTDMTQEGHCEACGKRWEELLGAVEIIEIQEED